MGLWTTEHAITLIPALAVMIIISVVLKITIGKKDLKTRLIPIRILACILVVLEIGKQLVSISRGYDLYHLPFHFCSLFIFVVPFMAFYNGKHKNLVYGTTTALCSALFLLMLIYPNLIYSAGNIKEFFTNYISFHTVAFHNIVMLEFLLILFLGIHNPSDTKSEQKTVIIFTVCFCVVAAVMAQILKTNYANMYTCNVPFFENIRLNLQGVLGYTVTQIIYVLILFVLNILFVYMAYWAARLLNSLINKTNTK